MTVEDAPDGSTTYAVSVGAGDVVTLTCGSIHADVLTGQAQIILAGGSTVAVPEGSAARVDQSQATGAYSVEQTSGTEPVTLTTVSSTGGVVVPTLVAGAPPVVQDGDVSAPRGTSVVVESDEVEVGDEIELAVAAADDVGVAAGEVSTDGGLAWEPMEDLDDHKTAELDASADVDLCARVRDVAVNVSQPLCVVVSVRDEGELQD